MEEIKFLCQGDTALVVEFGDKIDPELNRRVHRLSRKIRRECMQLIEAVVPTYRSLLVFFDPLQVERTALIEKISAMAENMQNEPGTDFGAKTVIIPTLYGGESGPDIEFVAEHNHLTIDDVIRIHTSVPYRIYMMGFTPGFPYLGGMSEKIATPRLTTPRTHIPAGSVGIAGMQTGLYPVESPGGWRLIGRTPLSVFDPQGKPPFLYGAGDFLQFEAISEPEYARIREEVLDGMFVPRSTPLKEVAE